jgi:hypothetical protein
MPRPTVALKGRLHLHRVRVRHRDVVAHALVAHEALLRALEQRLPLPVNGRLVHLHLCKPATPALLRVLTQHHKQRLLLVKHIHSHLRQRRRRAEQLPIDRIYVYQSMILGSAWSACVALRSVAAWTRLSFLPPQSSTSRSARSVASMSRVPAASAAAT